MNIRNLSTAFANTSRAPQAVNEQPLPPQLTISEQFSRVVMVLQQAQHRTLSAGQLQQDAAAQIDAATYALQRLRDEIKPALLLSKPAEAESPAVRDTHEHEPFRRRQAIAVAA